MMSDQKPPRVNADELSTAVALLQYQRESFLRKTADIDDEIAAASVVASGTSLLWLTNHMADAERVWLLHRFLGEDPRDDPPHGTTIAAARDRYRTTWAVSDRVINSFDDLGVRCPAFDDGEAVSLRWIVLHLLEETARHAGHADILRELHDGATGR